MTDRTLLRWLLPLALSGLTGCGALPTATPVQQSGRQMAQRPRAEMVSPGAALEAYATKHGLELRPLDLNRDSLPDVFKAYRPSQDRDGNPIKLLVRKDIDLNHDGKIDIIRFYDDQQEVKEERTDLDFDGRVDKISYYERGKITRLEIDINYDGQADLVKYYRKGKLARIESDRNTDGNLDTWEYYKDGELDRIGRDTDGDGDVDAWEQKRPERVADSSGATTAEEKKLETQKDAQKTPVKAPEDGEEGDSTEAQPSEADQASPT